MLIVSDCFSRLFEAQKLDFKDELAVGHDAPCRKATAPVGVIGGAGQSGDLSLCHTQDALVPSLDDLANSNFEREGGLSRILRGCLVMNESFRLNVLLFCDLF